MKIKHLCLSHQKGDHWANQCRSAHKNGSPCSLKSASGPTNSVGIHCEDLPAHPSVPNSLQFPPQSLPVEVLSWPPNLSNQVWINLIGSPHHHHTAHPVILCLGSKVPFYQGPSDSFWTEVALPLRASKFILGLLTQLIARNLEVMALSLINSMSFLKLNKLLNSFSLPYHALNNYNPVTRGEQGFGSTGDQVVFYLTNILWIMPYTRLKSKQKHSLEIVDFRADISIITSAQWSVDWPLTEPQEKIISLGNFNNLLKVQQFFLA